MQIMKQPITTFTATESSVGNAWNRNLFSFLSIVLSVDLIKESGYCCNHENPIAVSTYNNTVHTFGPYRLNSDDLWEICTISLPDGTITPRNRTSTKTKTSSAFLGNEKKLPEKLFSSP